MSLVNEVTYIKEPTDLQCGQAVLAMLTGKSVAEIINECGTDKETTLNQMKQVLTLNNICFDPQKKIAKSKEDLPEIAVLSLETPRCWHWSLYFKGTFFDPEHGVLNDFPICNRKYYFEIKNSKV
jgi:hypothetical protein